MAFFKKNEKEPEKEKRNTEIEKEKTVSENEKGTENETNERQSVKIDYWSLKDKISSYVSQGDNKAALSDNKANIYLKGIIQKYLYDNKYEVEGLTEEELIDRIYNDMAGLSILTKYLNRADELEEININAWNDIVLTYADGHKEKIKERFESPEHAIDIFRRMLHMSNIVVDNRTPMAEAQLLDYKARATVMITPVVDEEIGVSASIRFLHPQRVDRTQLITGGSATEEMLDFITLLVKYGVSIVVAGETSSGKTTTLNAFVSTMPDDMRIFVVETGARELYLRKFDENQKVTNNVVNTLARPTEEKVTNISQKDLLIKALRYNPEIIIMSEIRGDEVIATIEAAQTGHTVCTTIHSRGGQAAHFRMANLMANSSQANISDCMRNAVQAFPIIVYVKRLQDNSRKIMDISECECKLGDNSKMEYSYRSLYKYEINNTTIENGNVHIDGEFHKKNRISNTLKDMLINNGIPTKELERFL